MHEATAGDFYFFPGDQTKLKHLLFDANLTKEAAAKDWNITWV